MDYKKFIDSVVGNIARKIEDEFNENDHPRDKGGKFTSKGGEGKGGSSVSTSVDWGGNKEEAAKIAKKYGIEAKHSYQKGAPYGSVKLSGDPEKVKKAAIELYGTEEEAREFSPEIFGETETEKAAKEELSEQGSNEHDQIAEKLSADASSADEFLTRMGYDNFDIGNEEEISGLIKEAFKNNPNKALKVAGDYIELDGEDEDDESVKAGKETDSIVEEFKGSGIDMYAALADLGIDVQRTPEAYHEDVFKEKLFNSPKFRQKAKEYIKQYRGTEDEEEWFK